MKQIAAAVILVGLLAGCAQPGANFVRNDDIFITVQSSGEFRVGLPLPIDPITTSKEWELALRPAASAGSVTVAPGENGMMAWIEGNGTVHIEGLLRRTPSCCADSFHEGTWTTGETRSSANVRAFVDYGDVSLMSIHYEATSCHGVDCETAGENKQLCSLIFEASIGGSSEGWNLLPVRSDHISCSAAPGS